MHLRKPSPAGVIASLALFFALGGTALAAKHYLITSTSQIKPSVLGALHGSTGARGQTGSAGATGATGGAGANGQPGPVGGAGAQGPQGPAGPAGATVVARIRSVAPVATTFTEEENAASDDPLNGGWTQHAEELNQLTGQVTITFPPEAACEGSSVAVELLLDGSLVGGAAGKITELEKTETLPIGWAKEPPIGGPFEKWPEQSLSPWIFEPGKDTSHVLTARVADTCTGSGHPTIQGVSVDVLGVS
jgi:hypothetical protein